MCGFVALAVDVGRVQLARSEMQGAADAAACAALLKLPSVADAQIAARQAAAQNKANGSTINVVLNDNNDALSDVQFLKWSDRDHYTVLTGEDRAGANAVRVFTRLSRSRGNQVDVLFGRVLGMQSMDLERSATATFGADQYAVIGLQFINMGGNTTASYWPGFGGPAGSFGNVASNGPITLTGSSLIKGNASPGVGMTLNDPKKVTGVVRNLPQPLEFPDLPPTVPANYAVSNNNANLALYPAVYSGTQALPSMDFNTNKTYTYPGGLYFVQDFNVGSSATVTFTGPTTLVVCGTYTMTGSTETAANLPENLTLVTVRHNGTDPGTVKIWSTSAFYGTVYAPLSPIEMSGTGDIYGSLLGKSIDMMGTSAINYDMSLSNKGFRTMLVR
jgi:Flp pilus assembly protein TadG